MLDDILSNLSTNIFLKEHRYRYQIEQTNRYKASLCFSKKGYLLCSKNYEDFIEDYNQFLWKQIKCSHLYMSPKIDDNYSRTLYDGENSKYTSLVYYLYFKTSNISRFISRVLSSSYRNPYLDKQKKSI